MSYVQKSADSGYNIFLLYLDPEDLHLETSDADMEVKELLKEAEEIDMRTLEKEHAIQGDKK